MHTGDKRNAEWKLSLMRIVWPASSLLTQIRISHSLLLVCACRATTRRCVRRLASSRARRRSLSPLPLPLVSRRSHWPVPPPAWSRNPPLPLPWARLDRPLRVRLMRTRPRLEREWRTWCRLEHRDMRRRPTPPRARQHRRALSRRRTFSDEPPSTALCLVQPIFCRIKPCRLAHAFLKL